VRSRVAEAILLAALVAGRRGLFLGKKPLSIFDHDSFDGAIRTSRGWAVAHHFYPRITNSYVPLRKNDDEDVNRFARRFGVG
jgi:ABC-type thiamine transport system substrate-binding protein